MWGLGWKSHSHETRWHLFQRASAINHTITSLQCSRIENKVLEKFHYNRAYWLEAHNAGALMQNRRASSTARFHTEAHTSAPRQRSDDSRILQSNTTGRHFIWGVTRVCQFHWPNHWRVWLNSTDRCHSGHRGGNSLLNSVSLIGFREIWNENSLSFFLFCLLYIFFFWITCKKCQFPPLSKQQNTPFSL